MAQNYIAILEKSLKNLRNIWEHEGINEEEKNDRMKSFEESLKAFLKGQEETQRNFFENERREVGDLEERCDQMRLKLGETKTKKTEFSKDLKERKKSLREEETRLLKRQKGLEVLLKAKREELKTELEDLGKKIPKTDHDVSVNSLKFVLDELNFCRSERETIKRKIELKRNEIVKLQIALGVKNSPKEQTQKQKTIEILKGENSILNSLKTLKEKRVDETKSLLKRCGELRNKIPQETLNKLCGQFEKESTEDISAERIENLKKTVEILEEKTGEILREKVSESRRNIFRLWSHFKLPFERRGVSLSQLDFKGDAEEIMKKISTEETRLTQMEKTEKAIKDLTARRSETLRLREDFDDTDPKRFRIPGRLIKEEKIRARIKELPQLSRQLRKLAERLEEELCEPFCIDGTRLIDSLNKFEGEEKAQEEKRRNLLKARRNKRKDGDSGCATPLKTKVKGRCQSAKLDGKKSNSLNGARKCQTPAAKKKRILSNVPISLR